MSFDELKNAARSRMKLAGGKRRVVTSRFLCFMVFSLG